MNGTFERIMVDSSGKKIVVFKDGELENCYQATNKELIEWNNAQPANKKLSLEDSPPEIIQVDPDEKEFTPAERKRIRAFLRSLKE